MPSNAGSSSSRNTARPRRDRRQALIDAAVEVLNSDEADISAAAISRRAGVAHGLLFYYFGDKQGLVAAAMADVLSKLAVVQEPVDGELAPREQLEGFVRRHIEFVAEHRAAYVKVVRDGVLADPEVDRAVRAARDEGSQRIARLVGVADSPNPLTHRAISGWIGFLDRTADGYVDKPDIELEQVVRLIVDTLFSVLEAADRNGTPTG